MFLNAFALFFFAVLAGSVCALHLLLASNLKLIVAALRGEPLPRVQEVGPPRLVRVRSGRRLAFPPVAFRICRL